MQKVGAGMSAAITAPLAAIGTQIVKLGADFDSQMATLSIAAKSAGLSMDELRTAALQVGGDTQLLGVSATGAADSMTGLYKAGLTTGEIFGDLQGYMAGTAELGGALRAAIDLAAASELDMVQASDLAAITLATFGGELKTEAERAEFITGAMDNMVKAADASVAEVDGLAQALSFVGTTAFNAGYSLEDTNNALAILSTAGLDAGRAGRNLQSALASLQNPSNAAVDKMQALGIEIYDSQGNMKSMRGIIEELNGALAGMTKEQQDVAMGTLFTSGGIRAMLPLLNAGTDGWDDMAEATAKAAGIQEQAAAKADTLKGRMEALMGNVETLGIKLYDVLAPVLMDIVNNRLIPFIDRLNELNPNMLKWGVIIAGVAAALGPVLIVLGTLISAIGAIIGVLGAALLPVVALVAGIVALAVAWKTNFAGMRTFVQSWWGMLQPIFQSVREWFQEKLARALAVIREQWETKLKPAFGELVDYMGDKIPDVIATLSNFWENTLKPALDVVANFIIDTVIPAMADLVVWLAENIPVAIEAVSDFWTNTLLPAIDDVKAFITDKLIPAFEDIRDWLKDKLTKALDTLADFWENTLLPAMEAVKDWYDQHLGPMLESLQELLEVILVKALEVLAGVWENVLLPALTDAYNYIADKLQPVFEALSDFWTNTLVPAMETVADWFKNKLVQAWEALAGPLTRAKDNLLPGLSSAFDAVGSAIDKVKGWFDKLKDAISGWTPPAWITGHSPPPLANWLMDVADAASLAGDAMAGVALPGIPSLVGGSLASGAGGTTHNWGGNTSIYNVHDEQAMRWVQEKERREKRAALSRAYGMG